MNNYQLLGLQNDNFNIRLCLLVVAGFGVITIISYFNELARAGLLFHHKEPAPVPYFRPIVAGLADKDETFIQNNGEVQKIAINIKKLDKLVHGNYTRQKTGYTKVEKEKKIKIELHLGKNASYEKHLNSRIKIYTHHNTLGNFYTSVMSMTSKWKSRNNVSFKKKPTLKLAKLIRKYHNATSVLLYQHEPGGYFLRDCLKHLALKKDKVISKPLSAANRQEWEMLQGDRKDQFDVLYGGMSFGTCESIKRSCKYFTMLSHPIDRILTIFYLCKTNPEEIFCHFNKLDIRKASLRSFLKNQGSGLFQKLLYYTKHCKLVGQHELCIQDSKTSFILTQEERKVHLQNVLKNLEKWFSVIGIVENFTESMHLFEQALGYSFTKCPTKGDSAIILQRYKQLYFKGDNILIPELKQMRAKLLEDPQIMRWLHADLAIYTEAKKIFKKQLQALKSLNSIAVGDIRDRMIHKHGANQNLEKTTQTSLLRVTTRDRIKALKVERKRPSGNEDVHMTKQPGVLNVEKTPVRKNIHVTAKRSRLFKLKAIKDRKEDNSLDFREVRGHRRTVALMKKTGSRHVTVHNSLLSKSMANHQKHSKSKPGDSGLRSHRKVKTKLKTLDAKHAADKKSFATHP